MARARIEGQVAAILSKYEVAINRGAEDGVELGQRFVILGGTTPPILDPETNEPLGSTSVVSAVVKIVRIEGDHLSIGRTFRTVDGLFGASILPGFNSHQESLWLAEDAKVLRGERRPTAVGSRVVQTLGDEYDNP